MSRFFPDKGAPEADILAFRDRFMNRWSIARNRTLLRVAEDIWFMLAMHWFEIDPTAMFDGTRGAILRDMLDSDEARPVTNEIGAAAEIEIITLARKKWTAKCTPTSSDPQMKVAAQVAQDRIRYRLKQLSWDEKRHQLTWNFVVGGTSLLYTATDKTYMERVLRPAPDALACPSCETRLYSADVPTPMLQRGIANPAGGFNPIAHSETVESLPPTEDDLLAGKTDPYGRMRHCPTCSAPTPLQPFAPNEDEMEQGEDVFGRPLGIEEPRIQTALEVDQVHEFYPQNAGVRVTPDTLRMWGRRKIRSLDWIAEHYPHRVHLVQPDSISELLYDDPIFSQRSVLGHWSTGLYDSAVFEDHANVDEIVNLPNIYQPLGRYVCATKGVVLEEGDLLVPGQVTDIDGSVKSAWVPRAQMNAARYALRPSEFLGDGIARNGKSPQRRLNGLDYQYINARLKAGPSVIMPKGMWLDSPAREIPGVANVLIVDPDPSYPDQLSPIHFTGPMLTGDSFVERDKVQADVKRMLNNRDALQGQHIPGVSNTSQLQTLIEQGEQASGLREDELVGSAAKGWKHLLDIEWVLDADPDTYRVLGPDGAWKYEQYRGASLRGQTEIEIERQPYVSRSVLEREAAREALKDQVVVIDSPLARKRMAEKYGMETDINQDTNNQLDQAERRWVDFKEKGIVRTLDSVDDPNLIYQVLGAHLETDEGLRIATDAEWEKMQQSIAGWELDLIGLNVSEAKSIAFYGGARLSGEQAKEAYGQAVMAHERQLQLAAKQQLVQEQIATITAQPPPPPLPPPPPPQPPLDLPVILQDRILLVWIQKLKNKPPDVLSGPLTSEKKKSINGYLRFRSLIAACQVMIAGPGTGLIPANSPADVANLMMLGGQTAAPMPAPAPGSGKTMAPADKGGPALPPGPPGGGGGGGAGGGGNGSPPAGGDNPPGPGAPAPLPTGPEGGAS